MAQISTSVNFGCGLHGFHFYANTANWKPILGERISFKRELDNEHDKFAVAGQKILRGKLAPETIGHIPREIPRHVWYAILEGAKITAIVSDVTPKRSPLVQGGLEIPICVTVEWENIDGLKILKEKVDSVNFPFGENENYEDSSNKILQDLGGLLEDEEGNDDDVDVDI